MKYLTVLSDPNKECIHKFLNLKYIMFCNYCMSNKTSVQTSLKPLENVSCDGTGLLK